MANAAILLDSAVTALPTPQDVGAWYDNADSLCKLISGDSFHFGMWLRDDGTPAVKYRDPMTQAQDRMTDFFIDLLRPQPGQSMLDVGAGTAPPLFGRPSALVRTSRGAASVRLRSRRARGGRRRVG